jgi:hypothetical protein
MSGSWPQFACRLETLHIGSVLPLQGTADVEPGIRQVGLEDRRLLKQRDPLRGSGLFAQEALSTWTTAGATTELLASTGFGSAGHMELRRNAKAIGSLKAVEEVEHLSPRIFLCFRGLVPDNRPVYAERP